MKADEIKMEVATEPIEIRMPRFKKTRRGKKRRFNTDDDDDVNNPSHSPPSNNHVSEGDSLNTLTPEKDCPNQSFADPIPEGATTHSVITVSNSNCHKRLMLRPLEVPKAPSNSTQFIMDDHENCNLYVSFESPREIDDLCHSPRNGYRDINYEYESPDDLDTKAFIEKEFETIYRRAREDELLAISRSDLIEQVLELEERVSSYEKLLMNGGLPSVAQLQEELLKMQEDNSMLRKTKWSLMDDSGPNMTDSDLGDCELCYSMDDSDAGIDGCVQHALDQESTSLQHHTTEP